MDSARKSACLAGRPSGRMSNWLDEAKTKLDELDTMRHSLPMQIRPSNTPVRAGQAPAHYGTPDVNALADKNFTFMSPTPMTEKENFSPTPAPKMVAPPNTPCGTPMCHQIMSPMSMCGATPMMPSAPPNTPVAVSPTPKRSAPDAHVGAQCEEEAVRFSFVNPLNNLASPTPSKAAPKSLFQATSPNESSPTTAFTHTVVEAACDDISSAFTEKKEFVSAFSEKPAAKVSAFEPSTPKEGSPHGFARPAHVPAANEEDTTSAFSQQKEFVSAFSAQKDFTSAFSKISLNSGNNTRAGTPETEECPEAVLSPDGSCTVEGVEEVTESDPKARAAALVHDGGLPALTCVELDALMVSLGLPKEKLKAAKVKAIQAFIAPDAAEDECIVAFRAKKMHQLKVTQLDEFSNAHGLLKPRLKADKIAVVGQYLMKTLKQ